MERAMNSCLVCRHPINPAVDVAIGPRGHAHAVCESRCHNCITPEGVVRHDFGGNWADTEFRPERLRDIDDLEIRRLERCEGCGAQAWTPWASATESEAEQYMDDRTEAAEFYAEQSAMAAAEERESGL